MAITGQIAGSTILRKVRQKRGAVDLGRFGQRLVDIGQRRQQDQEHEGRPLPDLADDDRGIDEIGIDGPQQRPRGSPANQPMIWLIGP